MMAIRLGEFLAASAVTLSPIGNAGLGRLSRDHGSPSGQSQPGLPILGPTHREKRVTSEGQHGISLLYHRLSGRF